jgi:hypothetical protein
MTATATTDSTSDSDITDGVTDIVGGADTLTVERAQTLSLVQQARVTRANRNAAAAAAQYGSGSTQAGAAQSAAKSAATLSARVAVFQQQAATTAPAVPENGWALHGRLYDSSLQPVSAASVYLVDSTKAYQSAYGFAYTDDTGYFSLSYAGDTNASAAPTVYLAAANAKAEPVYLGTTAAPITIGSATYQNISLATANTPIGDPPAAIKKIALPPTKDDQST